MRDRVSRARSYITGKGLGPFLVRSVAGVGAIRAASMLASFLVGVQLARGLGVAGYGYYGIALAIVSLAGVPGELGLPPLVTREVAAADAKGNVAHVLGVVRWGTGLAARLSAAMAVLIFVGALVLAEIRPSPLVPALMAGAAVVPLMALLKVNGGALRGLREIIRGQLPAGLFKPAGMSVLLFLIYLLGLQLHPWIAVGLNAVTAAAALVIGAIWLSRRLSHDEHVEPVRDGRRWLSSMIPMALSAGILALQRQLSVLLLAVLVSPTDVGLFRIATATAVMLSAPQAIMFTVTSPMISRLHAQEDRRRLQTMLTHAAQFQFAGVLLLSLPLFIAPGPILAFVYGHQFAAASEVLRIILVGQLITTAFGLNGGVLNMTHHERRVTRAMTIALVLNAVTFVAFVPLWGTIGAAIGFVVSMLAWNIVTWLDARRLVGVDTSALPLAIR